MSEAISATSSSLPESVSKTVAPTIGATSLGRCVGRLAGAGPRLGPLRLGSLLAVAAIPLALAVFAWQLLPPAMRRYRLTNRRIVVRKGLRGPEHGIDLEDFDEMRIETRPGHEYLRCGDLVVLRQGEEVLRLPAVPRPAVFRQICLEARATRLAMRRTLEATAAGRP